MNVGHRRYSIGNVYGYVRVSRIDRNEDRQIMAMSDNHVPKGKVYLLIVVRNCFAILNQSIFNRNLTFFNKNFTFFCIAFQFILWYIELINTTVNRYAF